jgi:predicted metal-dependent peptidase
MDTDNSISLAAKGRMQIALMRLAGDYPFHVAILERFALVPRTDIQTMAVTIIDRDLQLLYSPDFVLSLSLDQLGGAILHELHHVLFNHLLKDPEEYPDRWARIVAEEVTVNEFITEPLPDGLILLKDFPQLPPMESTDRRYRRLVRIAKRARSEISEIPSFGGNGASTAGDGATRNAGGGIASVLDDHAYWQSARDDPASAASAVQDAIQHARYSVADADIPAYLREVLDQAFGVSSGHRTERVDEHREGDLNWVQLLRRYVGIVLSPGADLSRPPRRFPQLVGLIPGRRRRSRRPQVMAVIDTSASINPEQLLAINAEMSRIAREHRVTVVECDLRICRVYPYKRIVEVQGRGGTDLRPPFARAVLRKLQPDLIVYFSDGQGPAPDDPPPVPVIWCLLPGGIVPAKWGRVVKIG